MCLIEGTCTYMGGGGWGGGGGVTGLKLVGVPFTGTTISLFRPYLILINFHKNSKIFETIENKPGGGHGSLGDGLFEPCHSDWYSFEKLCESFKTKTNVTGFK